MERWVRKRFGRKVELCINHIQYEGDAGRFVIVVVKFFCGFHLLGQYFDNVSLNLLRLTFHRGLYNQRDCPDGDNAIPFYVFAFLIFPMAFVIPSIIMNTYSANGGLQPCLVSTELDPMTNQVDALDFSCLVDNVFSGICTVFRLYSYGNGKILKDHWRSLLFMIVFFD